MNKSYITGSPVFGGSAAVMIAGFALTFGATTTGLPTWLVPVGYFAALASAAVMFIGWVRWRRTRTRDG